MRVLLRLVMPRHPSCARVRLAELSLRPLATLQFSFTSDSTVVKDHKMEGAALVGLTRVGLVTSSLSGTRSNQLSYKPVVCRKGDGTLSREHT